MEVYVVAIVVAVHSQDSMRLACVNAVLAVHCNYFGGSSYAKDMYELYAVIQKWLLTLYEHFIHVCYLGTSNKLQYMYMYIHVYLYIYMYMILKAKANAHL